MDILLNSNLFNLFLTAVIGCVLFAVYYYFPKLLAYSSYFISIGVIASFTFEYGEVYIFSDYYKRAFNYFTDDIATVLAFLFLYAFFKKLNIASLLCLCALIMTGGKVAIVILIFGFIASNIFIFNETKKNFLKISSMLLIATITYFSCHTLPRLVERHINSSTNISKQNSTIHKTKAAKRYSSCKTVYKCFETQVLQTIKARYVSSLAGIWMMNEGRFYRKNYPNTAEKFANLMMSENPYGLNSKFNMTFKQWKAIGVVQNPYISFGSAYGIYGFILLISSILFVYFLAYRNFRMTSDKDKQFLCLMFIVFTSLSQTQSWLNSYSPILILYSFMGVYIVFLYLESNLNIKRNVTKRS